MNKHEEAMIRDMQTVQVATSFVVKFPVTLNKRTEAMIRDKQTVQVARSFVVRFLVTLNKHKEAVIKYYIIVLLFQNCAWRINSKNRMRNFAQ